jgi:hypothetical protein
MATQSRGAPYPLSTDANNTAADIQALSLWVNDRPGVTPLTTVQINALAGIERWDGRLVLDTTVDRVKRWDAGTTTWVTIPDNGDIAALLATTGLPAALGTASRGVSSSAARADHVHPEPGAWTAYTPTLTGFTVQAGAEAYYSALGKRVHVTYRGVLAGVPTGAMTVTLPFTAARLPASTLVLGPAYAGDVSANIYAVGAAYVDTTARVGFVSNGNNAVWAAPQPFTWAAGDTISFTLTYERA